MPCAPAQLPCQPASAVILLNTSAAQLAAPVRLVQHARTSAGRPIHATPRAHDEANAADAPAQAMCMHIVPLRCACTCRRTVFTTHVSVPLAAPKSLSAFLSTVEGQEQQLCGVVCVVRSHHHQHNKQQAPQCTTFRCMRVHACTSPVPYSPNLQPTTPPPSEKTLLPPPRPGQPTRGSAPCLSGAAAWALAVGATALFKEHTHGHTVER